VLVYQPHAEQWSVKKKIKQNPKLICSVTRILWRKGKPPRIHSEVVRLNVICPNDRYTYIVYVRELHFCSFLVFLLEKLFFGYWIIIETELQFFQFRGFAALTKIIEFIFRWRHSLPLVFKKKNPCIQSSLGTKEVLLQVRLVRRTGPIRTSTIHPVA